MALAEFPDPQMAAHRHAVDTKAWVRDRLRALVDELANDHEIGDAAALADRLALVMEGVYGSVAALGATGPAIEAHRLVESLLPQTHAIRP